MCLLVTKTLISFSATRNPSLTNYMSVVSFHKDKAELSANLCVDMGCEYLVF
jgi:hypothetical protein